MDNYSQPRENIFQIFFKGLLIYLKKFLPFSRAMLFPVLGQLAGIVLILGPVYFYRQYFLTPMPVEKLQENIIFILLGLILLIIPGFIIFLKAFWDYMIVMVSLNTMTAEIIKKNTFDDFKAHNNAVKSRSRDYIILLFILMGIWLIFLTAPFIILIPGFYFLNKIFSLFIFALSALICLLALAMVSIYLCLSFQVFAFEKTNPVNVIRTSFKMMKNNVWRAIVLGFVLFILTSAIAPLVFQLLIKNSPIMTYLVTPFESYLNILVENPAVFFFIEKLTAFIPDIADKIAKETALLTVGMAVTAFILPLGSACFTLFYLDIKNNIEKEY